MFMSMKSRRWLGIALIAVAIVIFIASSNFWVDVPGPMEASKLEFTYSFNVPFTVLSVILVLAGEIFLALIFRKKP